MRDNGDACPHQATNNRPLDVKAMRKNIATQIKPLAFIELPGKQSVLWTIEGQEVIQLGFRDDRMFAGFIVPDVGQEAVVVDDIADFDVAPVVSLKLVACDKPNSREGRRFFRVDASLAAGHENNGYLTGVVVNDSAQTKVGFSITDPSLAFGKYVHELTVAEVYASLTLSGGGCELLCGIR